MSTEEEYDPNQEAEWNAETLAILEQYEREKAEAEERAKIQSKPPATKPAYQRVAVSQTQTPAKKTVTQKGPEGTSWRERTTATGDEGTTKILEDFEILRFYQLREQYPTQSTYTSEGNLQLKGIKGVQDKVIPMKQVFVPLTEPEYAELMEARKTALVEKERAYEMAISTLRTMTEAYKRREVSAEVVVNANNAVRIASEQRSKVAYPEKWINLLENPVTLEVLMMYDPYEKRKLGYDVAIFKHHELKLKEAFGKYTERSTTSEEEQAGGGFKIRFITDTEDPITGHFHPFYQRNFKYNETEYCCIYQAYHGERFKQLGKEDLRKQVLGTRSGRTIHAISLKDKTLINAPQQLWEEIVFQFFYQHPDLRKELDATGTDKFHVMDKEIPADYGTVVEQARLRLRELGDKELDHQEVKEHVITEEEQKKAKVGAIIHNFKKKF